MEFWNEHSILFFLGLIFIPRLMLIYFGSIPAFSVQPLLGMLFIPRLFLAWLLTPVYWDVNPTTIVFIWIIAVLGDVIETIVKFKFSIMMWTAQMEAYREAMAKARQGYL